MEPLSAATVSPKMPKAKAASRIIFICNVSINNRLGGISDVLDAQQENTMILRQRTASFAQKVRTIDMTRRTYKAFVFRYVCQRIEFSWARQLHSMWSWNEEVFTFSILRVIYLSLAISSVAGSTFCYSDCTFTDTQGRFYNFSALVEYVFK